jgi:serine/threonine protein kinase
MTSGSPASLPPDLPPEDSEQRVGPYRILERLGEGSAGQVFKARHQALEHLVALRLVRKELLADADVVDRFCRQVQVLSSLDHPNIARVHDAGPVWPAAGKAGVTSYFLAVDFVEGTDLERLVRAEGPLPVLQVCSCVRQAALALQQVYQRGLMHGRIRPHNLIRCRTDGVIKLADLGLAPLPQPGSTTGTVAPFQAPEQALGLRSVDIRADIYGLGCVLHYLLTGQVPSPGRQEASALDRQRPDLPNGLAAVVAKMMADRPEDRFRTPEDVADHLAEFLEPRWGLPAVPALGEPVRFPRHWLLIAGLGAIALLGGLFCLYLLRAPTSTARQVPSPNDELSQPLVAWDELQREQIPAAERTQLSAEVVAVFAHQDQPEILGMAVSSRFVAACGGNTITLWEPATGNHRSIQTSLPVHDVRLTPDGPLLAALLVKKEQAGIVLYSLATGKEHLIFGETRPYRAESGLPLAYSPDGRVLGTGGHDGRVTIWDAITGSPRLTLVGHTSMVSSLAFTADGQTLISGSWDQSVKRRNLNDPDDRRTITTTAEVSAVAAAPDGRLAFAVKDSTVHFWSPATRLTETLVLKEPGVVSLVFTGDGKRLASLNRERLVLWDATSGANVWQWSLPAHGNRGALALAPDGRHLAVACGATVYVVRLPGAPGR